MGPVYSFTFARQASLAALPQIGARELLLALLAGVPVEGDLEGAEVGLGEAPSDPESTICVVTAGPAAELLQERLVVALERIGIPVDAVYEGGPAVFETVARAHGARWQP